MPALAVHPPTGASNSHGVGLHDLTTPKTYSPCVATRLVGSYPTFSPLPQPEDGGGCFLLRYSTLTDSFLLGSGMLCVARTFLIRTRRKRQTDQLLYGVQRYGILMKNEG